LKGKLERCKKEQNIAIEKGIKKKDEGSRKS
jgi:hypothetical protein